MATVATNPDKLARWRQLTLLILLAYSLVLFAGTHWPKPPLPATNHLDKLLHFVAYFGLAALAWSFLWLRRPVTWKTTAVLFVGLVVWGAIDELLQIPIRGRSAEWLDWVADGVGAAAGVGCCVAARAIWRACRNRASFSANAAAQ